MSFSIKLFQNNSETNKIGKDLTLMSEISGNLKDECSITSPVFLVESNTPIFANYCYVEEFRRYYFINDVTCVKTNLWRISMKCDVIESFADNIKANVAILRRTSQDELANLYIPDEKRIVLTETFTRYKKFPNGCFSGIKNSAGNYNFLVLMSGVEPGKG